MTATPLPGPDERLSLPPRLRLPRPLDGDELRTLRAVADTLVPATGEAPAASAEPGYDEALLVAVTARADAFAEIAGALAELRDADPAGLDRALRAMHDERPATFQPLSAVVAGAWLTLPAVRARIGYPGQTRNPAAFGEGVDEISDGILDPVLARGPIFRPA